MYEVNNEFKTAISSSTRQIKAYFVFNDVQYIPISVAIDDFVYSNDTFIGNFIAKNGTIKVDLKDDLHLENENIDLYFGVVLPDETIEYVPMGKYYIYEVISEVEYKIIDSKLLFNVPFDTSNISYPTKPFLLLQEACRQAQIELDTETFINSDILISEPVFFGYDATCNNVVEAVAQASCSAAVITRDNKLKLKWINPVDFSIEKNNWKTKPLIVYPFGPINSIVLAREPQNDLVAWPEEITGERIEYKIVNNPILDIDRYNSIQPIYSLLNGFFYVPITIETQGFFHLDTLDLVKIRLADNTYINMLIMNHTINFMGGISSKFETPALTKMQSNYSIADFTQKVIYETELEVDKQNGKIDAIVSKVDGQGDQIADMELDIESIKSTVTEVNNYNVIYNFNSEFGFDGWTFENGSLLPEVNLLPGNDVLPIGYTTPTFLSKEYPDSLSKLGLYFYSDGYAITGLARILVNDGTQYSFKCKREETANQFTLYILEYDIDKEFIKETMILDTTNPQPYEMASITFDESTSYVSIKIQSYADQPFGISELMFNRGSPREYVINPEDIYYYSKTSIEQLSDEINLKVDKDGIISQINLTPEEIKILANKLSLEGLTTINGKVTIDLDGKLTGLEAKFTDGEFSGAIKGSSFTGTGDNSFIDLGNGNFRVDGNGVMVSKSGGSMTVYGVGENTGVNVGIGILDGKIIFYREGTKGNYSNWGYIHADSPAWIIDSGERLDLNPIYVNGHWFVAGTVASNYLRVSNNATIQGNAYATQFIPISDEKAKKDIKDIDISKMIDIIKVKKYILKNTGQDSVGVIAQSFKNTEFEKIILIERPDGQLGIDYNAITMALVQRVQELSKAVEKLNKKENK